MIVYQKNKETFFHDVRNDTVADQARSSVLEKLGQNTANNEFESWRNSLCYMRDASDHPDIPSDCRVIEFQTPCISKRVAVTEGASAVGTSLFSNTDPLLIG